MSTKTKPKVRVSREDRAWRADTPLASTDRTPAPPPPHPRAGPSTAPTPHWTGSLVSRALNEGYPKVPEDITITEKALSCVLNVKAIVATFNQEKALSRGLLRDYEPSDGPSFQALVLP